MNKILSGVLGIVMVASVTGGTAYALFTSQATVQGISISAGSASLRINDGTDNFISNWDTGLSLENVAPGYTNETLIELENASTANIALAVKAQLTAATGWPALKDDVFVEVQLASDAGQTTGAHSLSEWNAAAIDFPGTAIAFGATEQYRVIVTVPTDADNSIAGQTLTGIQFTLTGTQAP